MLLRAVRVTCLVLCGGLAGAGVLGSALGVSWGVEVYSVWHLDPHDPPMGGYWFPFIVFITALSLWALGLTGLAIAKRALPDQEAGGRGLLVAAKVAALLWLVWPGAALFAEARHGFRGLVVSSLDGLLAVLLAGTLGGVGLLALPLSPWRRGWRHVAVITVICLGASLALFFYVYWVGFAALFAAVPVMCMLLLYASPEPADQDAEASRSVPQQSSSG